MNKNGLDVETVENEEMGNEIVEELTAPEPETATAETENTMTNLNSPPPQDQ